MKKINNPTFFLIWLNIIIIAIIIGSIILHSKFTQNNKMVNKRKYSDFQSQKTEVIKANEKSEKKNIVEEVIIFPDSIRDRIIYAYTRGRIDIFETLIEQGIDFNNRMDNVNQQTVLMKLAATLSSTVNVKSSIIRLLIENGAEINIRDKYGRTAIFFSIYPEISKLFIDKDAELEIKDKYGNTALIRSTSWPHSQMLIKNGANINAQNNDGYSYLMSAAKILELENIIFLINNGANIFAKDDSGKNILMYSTKSEITEYLIKSGLNVNSLDHVQRSPLHHTILGLKRSKKNVEILLKYGANINAKNWRGEVPIMLSVKYGAKEITKLLIENNAEFDKEELLLQFARANKFDKELALYLFGHKVEINYQDSNGRTALIHAVKRGSRDIIKILKLLFEQNPDVNICDNNGQSAIFYSVGFPPRKEALKFLIIHGADLNIKDKWNKTPLSYAKANCDSSIVNILLNNGANR